MNSEKATRLTNKQEIFIHTRTVYPRDLRCGDHDFTVSQ